jgi:hypothetical protein
MSNILLSLSILVGGVTIAATAAIVILYQWGILVF